MKLRPEQVERETAKSLLPAYLVCGDEALIVGETLDLLRAAARRQGFETRDLLVAERGFDWSQLTVAAQSLSLFSDRKIIDLRLPTGKPGRPGSEAISEFLSMPGDDNLLIVSAPKLDGSAMSSKWVKAIDAVGAVVRVWPVEARDLPGWIQTRMQRAGLQADRDAVLQLARRVEGNLLAAQQEIDKLALLHEGSAITAEDIDTAVADSARYDVFLLVDEALAGRTARALRMVGGLRREGVVPVMMLWALAREARQLAALREQIDAGATANAAIRAARVWQKRQPLVARAVGVLDGKSSGYLLTLCERADRAAKGMSGEDPWQLILRIVTLIATGKTDGLLAA
ncbi:MAG: DNA polymerase III subunit delta [Pseudomonadota bacterium]